MTNKLRAVGRSPWCIIPVTVAGLSLSGCSLMSAAGPSVGNVRGAENEAVANANIRIVPVTDAVARQVIASQQAASFAEGMGDAPLPGQTVGLGDVVDVAIWEAPPAALFGAVTGGTSELMQAANQTARGTSLPEQMVEGDGRITIPFVGRVPAVGRTPTEIARDIAGRLRGIAHEPQVVVRLVRNVTRTVTVVGDVASSARVPLTAKGERLLDVLASVGGVKQPVNKTMIQVTRGERVLSEPLETIVTDARQNIRLQADDVVTAYFQKYSFTALGATSANTEVNFEGTGITLAQALGRVGGLNDQRSNPRGVFLFRLEDPAALDPAITNGARTTPDGKIPVIYRIDMKDPATFFVAQSFPVRNRDVLYVSNAPIADLQKFLNIVSSVIIPAVTVQNATR